MSILIVGIDPGVDGAIAAITWNPISKKAYANFTDNLWLNDDRTVHVRQLHQTLIAVQPKAVVIEAVNAMPRRAGFKQAKMGAKSMFNFGYNAGQIDAVARIAVKNVYYASPLFWKRRAGLIGEEKAASLELARELFPQMVLRLRHGRGHGTKAAAIGRAEALLIAYFGYRCE